MEETRRVRSITLCSLRVILGLAIVLLVAGGIGQKGDALSGGALLGIAFNGAELAKKARLLPIRAAAAELPAPGAVIAIDPGHGSSEIGAEYDFPDGTSLLEKDLNLRVALKVADLLTKAGYRPVLTRKTDSHVNDPPRSLTGRLPIGLADDLQARVDIANNAGARLFLSIHFNGSVDNGLHGSEVYYSEGRPFAADSQRFAKLILQNLAKDLAAIGYQGPGAVMTDMQAVGQGNHFYVLGPQSDIVTRPSAMPAALGEALFLTNAGDASLLRNGRTLDQIALAYATAVHQYFVGSAVQLPSLQSSSGAPAIGQGTITTDHSIGALLRAQPNTTGDIVQQLPDGTTVDLLKLTNGQEVVSGDARWYRARSDSNEGYVYAQLVQTTGTSQVASTPAQPSLNQGVIASQFGTGAMLRAGPNTSSDVVRALPEGDSVDLLQAVNGEAVIAEDARWYRARYDGTEGYVYNALVRGSSSAGSASVFAPASSPAPATTASTGLGTGTVQTVLGTGALLRASPNTSSDPVVAVPEGESVDLLQVTNGEAVVPGEGRWYRAGYAGSQGYVYATLVKRILNN